MNRKFRKIFAAKTARMPILKVMEYAAASVRDFSAPLSDDELEMEAELTEMAEGSEWFHGGMPGRAVGDLLLPACETGADPRGGANKWAYRAEAVYITRHERKAARYAAEVDGVVYRVKPLGPIGADKNDLRAIPLICASKAFRDLQRQYRGLDAVGAFYEMGFGAFTCPRAEVLEVLE